MMKSTWEEGRNKLEAGIDWLTFRGHSKNKDDVLRLFHSLQKNSVIPPEHRGDYQPFPHGEKYESCWRNGKGTTIFYTETLDSFHCAINLSGGFFANKGFVETLTKIADWHDNYKADSTRIDGAVDDYTKEFPVQEMLDAIRNKNIARFRVSDLRNPQSLDEEKGWTQYLGSTESTSYSRIYEKGIESGGVINSIRFETVWKQDKARLVTAELVKKFRETKLRYNKCDKSKQQINEEIGTEMAIWWGAKILGNVDFVDSERRNKEKQGCTEKYRLPWWQEFCDKCGGHIKTSLKRGITPLQKKHKWACKVIGKYLATLDLGLGITGLYDIVSGLVKQGKQKLKPVDYDNIYTLKEHGVQALIWGSSW